MAPSLNGGKKSRSNRVTAHPDTPTIASTTPILKTGKRKLNRIIIATNCLSTRKINPSSACATALDDGKVLPSYREGLPKSLIEAAACALPLVTSDVPGCREVVTHEVDGLLVPVKDAQALADAIERLHLDPAWARQLGLAARSRALREFDEKIVIRKTLAVYEELLK